jgi:hypothetical protein
MLKCTRGFTLAKRRKQYRHRNRNQGPGGTAPCRCRSALGGASWNPIDAKPGHDKATVSVPRCTRQTPHCPKSKPQLPLNGINHPREGTQFRLGQFLRHSSLPQGTHCPPLSRLHNTHKLHFFSILCLLSAEGPSPRGSASVVPPLAKHPKAHAPMLWS